MSAAEHIEEARRWLRYAQEDLVAAEAMIGRSDFGEFDRVGG